MGPWSNGAVAQLGERCVRNAEVGGSIPLGSTIRHLEARKPVYRSRSTPMLGGAVVFENEFAFRDRA
jgi:hypothetical protein